MIHLHMLTRRLPRATRVTLLISVLCGVVPGALGGEAQRSQPPTAYPIPLGRHQAPHEVGIDATISNNAAPDISPGVDTGSRLPIPHDRDGMVDRTPGDSE